MSSMADRMRARVKDRPQRKCIRGTREFSYPFMYTRDLADTPKKGPHFTMRFAPDNAAKNPFGFAIYAYHEIELEPGNWYGSPEDFPKITKVLARESSSYANSEKVEGSSLIYSIVEALDKPKIINQLSQDVQEALVLLDGKVEYHFLTLWYVEQSEKVNERGKIKKIWIPADPEEVAPKGFRWCISASSLYDKILDEYRVKDPNFNHIKDGRYFTFRKNGSNYDLIAEPYPEALDPRASDLIAESKFPDLNKIGQKDHKTLAQVEELLQKAWWWDYVAPFLEEFGFE